MELLTKEDIIQFNKFTINEHGGSFVPPFNLLNEDRIEYLLEAVHEELFGVPMYPSISDKAAFYMFSIVTGHILQDGNKRTGLGAARLFLKLNGLNMNPKVVQIKLGNGKFIPALGEKPKMILENFTLEMASGQISLDEAKLWFSTNIYDPNVDATSDTENF